MLSITNLRKIYKGTDKGIKDLTLTIENGDICAFIGPNGAGKTTALKAIVGIHPYEQGTIALNDINLQTDPQKFKSMLGYSPDNPDIYENLRGYEYLNFIGSIYAVPNQKFQQEVDYLTEQLDLKKSLSQLISSYSHGMKQRLVLISIFLHNPELIILDEPFVGLDPNASYFLTNELQKRAQAGAKVIYSTHVLEVAEKICNRVVLIDNGKVKVNRLMQELVAKETLGEIFRRETAR
ncbi:ABC transporter ATP-binding protein [Tetragenococcus koreensis]|uniref:ABC transporter ATP-binding protein n=1 Tax=Tetragenococcus koreensis TaxID=290335 RepID=A0AAN4UAR9_9ENTE|nr:ABC transporter ATP-binding protein [Tetragenococcus koreensis]MCF1584096.1 ABC transporter ATP-binding protein [Tetragenococcus koreensis]MCF1613557.1 ABC transporter ATP-binding protein [Tetragenococcus koreensis]MCF1618406.1 ABC transporter ATP-binding protein [Tetragenococcus koreensis]MCF1618706.1 ABC transporter ATP-binding protein [Tetragenococcus koreensis]MCF1623175.1 ABC transporter ATP-binding protein [Tetragenococcus koreensis]